MEVLEVLKDLKLRVRLFQVNTLWRDWVWPTWLVRPLYYRKWKKAMGRLYPGDFFINCDYDPCIVIGYSEEGDIEAWNVIGRHVTSCSLWHCGPEPIDSHRAEELVKIHEVDGKPGLMEAGGWSIEEIQAFYKNWRPEEKLVGRFAVNVLSVPVIVDKAGF